MITLIPLGAESLASLEGALDRLGYDHCRAGRPDQAAQAGPVILLGAGPLDRACQALKATGWWQELPQVAADGRPVLGLNAGLHLLAEASEECPRAAGLGLIPGLVRRLGPGAKMPHWGWTPVRQVRDHPLLPDLRGGWLFFAHSYALEPSSETLSIAVHGRPFSVMECRGRAVGLQAQLERSGRLGLKFLDQILEGLGEKPGRRSGAN